MSFLIVIKKALINMLMSAFLGLLLFSLDKKGFKIIFKKLLKET